MKDVKVGLGLPLVLEIQFVGEPQPEVTWLFGDKPMPDKVLVDVKEGYTTLHFPPTKRGDSGSYNLSLVNDSGQAEGSINLIVQGAVAVVIFILSSSSRFSLSQAHQHLRKDRLK